MLITILNTLLITIQNDFFILIHLNRKISLFSQIFKAVATIRGQEKLKHTQRLLLYEGDIFPVPIKYNGKN